MPAAKKEKRPFVLVGVNFNRGEENHEDELRLEAGQEILDEHNLTKDELKALNEMDLISKPGVDYEKAVSEHGVTYFKPVEKTED